MLDTSIFDDRRYADVDRNRRAFFPAYCADPYHRSQYLARREVNREKDPFITELVVLESENICSD
jgi:hypothetical protein